MSTSTDGDFGALVSSRATFLAGLRLSLLIAAGIAVAAACVSALARPSAVSMERMQS